MPAERITIYPLGGLGEIGMNCMLISTGETMIMVDCGLMFPSDNLLGVDVVIPRFDFPRECRERLKGIILTHGHEDHIGALPWLPMIENLPLYGSRFTLALVESKLKEHGLKPILKPVSSHERIELGDMAVKFFPVCHSIIQGYALGIETPLGRIVHTGDFKIDPESLEGQDTDLDGLSAFAENQALLLMADSTNVEREGYSLSEKQIARTLENIFAEATGRIIITLFASNIQRMEKVFALAAAHGRTVAIDGRSMLNNIALAKDLGFLKPPSGAQKPLEAAQALPDEKVVLLVTGSQGEPLSVLSRISTGEHRQIKIHQGDTVIMSSRCIPGNMRAITRVIDRLYKLGAKVLYEQVEGIHASGHAYREELRSMITMINPRFFVPVHGEYRHLVHHCQLARECGVPPERTILLENGRPLTLLANSEFRLEEPLDVEPIYVDGKGVGDVGRAVIKERRLLGEEGLVVMALVVDDLSGRILAGPEIRSKGFVFEEQSGHVLEEARRIILEVFNNSQQAEVDKLKERIHSSLRKYFRKSLDRDPVILPVIIRL